MTLKEKYEKARLIYEKAESRHDVFVLAFLRDKTGSDEIESAYENSFDVYCEATVAFCKVRDELAKSGYDVPEYEF